ncbi:multisubunit sodium/proton antiporter, MrpD subunit [Actinomadura meyerae]|uniref:Multisubunit sodium/proton antiporter, MrpD subunit n=1 Tax=Actinomadura meyerae TaxID=240840 RepID=A0A239NMI9_9ACTN|nr:complex I subunit 5 family protein [Actinomadura meyerae]SNT56075.1 multisubunit sodium/proton antiporter, MrpD subunit [Actinomadura meyerae]
MNELVPLVVALPLICAALLAAVGQHLPRLLPDAVAIACAAAVTGMSLVLTLDSADRTIVYWFGDWSPVQGGFPWGIGFVVEPLAAAEATLAAAAVLGALVFSWGHFENIRHLFYSLMLAFLAGMVGFVLSGDLFNIFVFLELMSVAAYALSGYHVKRPEVLQGALDFAVLNTIGTLTLLMGIGVLYGRTGNLNLVGVGTALEQHHPSGLLVLALTFITVGFLVKAGTAPFHFWLTDAYSVATAPAAAIFTAVMSDLAYDVYSRVHSTVFAPTLGDDDAVRHALLGLALLSAVLGAVMCFLEADLKRQLAFMTVSNGGVVLAGIATLTADGLAGSVMYIITAGLLRGALMLCLGMLIVRLGSADEMALHGWGRHGGHFVLAALLTLCAAGLATPPGFGPFQSAALVYDALAAGGYAWMAPVLAVCIAVSAAAVLRAVARIFLGWGPAHDPALTSQGSEPHRLDGHHRLWPLLAPLFLAATGYFLAFASDLPAHAMKAAADLHDHASHARLVTQGVTPPSRPLPEHTIASRDWLYGAVSFAGAFVLAGLGLWWQRLPDRFLKPLRACLRPPILAVKTVHSGSIGDYTTWLIAATAALALAWAATL